MKYLIMSENKYYNSNGEEVDITELTSSNFEEYGSDSLPTSDVLTALTSPYVYKWADDETIEGMTMDVTATPPTQTVQATIYFTSDKMITGIDSAEAEYTGDIGVKYSYDTVTFTDEVTMGEFLAMDMSEIYDGLTSAETLTMAFVIYKDSTLTRFKFNFIN